MYKKDQILNKNVIDYKQTRKKYHMNQKNKNKQNQTKPNKQPNQTRQNKKKSGNK